MRKILALLVIIVTAAALSGCISVKTQEISNEAIQGLLCTLPHSFTGTKHIDHSNAFVTFSLDFTGLKYDEATKLWTWTSAKYSGHSPWTTTNISDTPETSK